jgi:hypothetical protein
MLKILNEKDILNIREDLKKKYLEVISEFEEKSISKINSLISERITLNNEGLEFSNSFPIKINLEKSKFKIQDLYEEILKKGDEILNSSNVIISLKISPNEHYFKNKKVFENGVFNSNSDILEELNLEIKIEIKI